MKTSSDKLKQIYNEINHAKAKKDLARKLYDEAEEEMIQARIKLKEEEKKGNKVYYE